MSTRRVRKTKGKIPKKKISVEKLGQLLIQETKFLSEIGGEIEWLRTELRWMESFLKDADAKRRKGDERVKNWVRDVAYQAEDVVDLFFLQNDSKQGAIAEFFRSYICFLSDLVGLHELGVEISQIKSKVLRICESRDAYGIVSLSESREQSSYSAVDAMLQVRRQSSPHLDDDMVVVGFDTYKQFILELLLDTNIARRCVISIVGMGGLGKTTLATMVYNSSEVETHFSICAWITVSQDYRVSELLKNIMKRVMGTVFTGEHYERLENLEEDELKSKLYNFLKQTRYLIVLDDIWAQEAWEQIKAAFPNAKNGSRVLLTTRLMDVARSADPRVPPYELPFLTHEQSWELFLKKAFPSDQDFTPSCPKELEELGHEIVKRCGGLPLAVVVLGGLLSRKEPAFNTWLEVAENVDWESTRDGQQCLQILALSYSHLPDHYLKSCFLYLGCFPEDYQMKASELIRLWIAEGFIPQSGRQTLEETAKGYMEELVQRCMVQVVDRSAATRKVKHLRIHDLVRDVCITEAKEDGFFRIFRNYVGTAEHDVAASRRLVIFDKALSGDFHYSVCRARTVLAFNSKSINAMILTNILLGFKLLRVIHLNCPPEVEFHKLKLPNEISSLIHLRYITLRTRRLWYLPSSIGNLCNLQTLNVRETSICTLPKTIYKIQTLRHVYTADAGVCSSSIGNLASLQTLKVVKAGSWIQNSLAKLSSLRKLAISEISIDVITTLSDSLPKLNHLTSLNLRTHQSIPASPLFTSLPSYQHLCKLTLEGSWTGICKLPQNLISLSLLCCKLDKDAIAALERLPSLSFLNLDSCELAQDEMVFSAGGFPRLQILLVNHLDALRYWRIESGAMSDLTDLRIKNCIKLMKLPDGLEHLSLKNLVMKGFQPNIMRRLSSMGPDWHKVEHIPSLMIDPTTGE
ncbi:putative disease resistance protein At1g50180 isoform X2 [Asparagus officinalis]|uniref:putative disease resistance protein At1g50180 isoform X2 n=1 Tax=Asparagus officinalis TaxID=4686 RepID=UPI00098E2D9A|nr:putative disease resistance protein At1g50180 isoform X2 [Asparagus officinalis]